MPVREIRTEEIEKAVKKLFIEANYRLPCATEKKIEQALQTETSAPCKMALTAIRDNLSAAEELNIPICQDTGMAVLFAEIGRDVHFDGPFEEAVNRGVHAAYLEGYMRCSVVKDPMNRLNTNDNTPAVIHTTITEGNTVTLTAAPKGFGSENMSRIQMFNPTAERQEIIRFVAETVKTAASNPCPPVIVGVGIGGTFEKAALLSKKALTRDLDIKNNDPFYAQLEKDMLTAVNQTGIGAQGFGGCVTALGVNIETFATHIAGLPVAVNMGCHVTRHSTIII